jgi:hypothetical protein
MQGTKEAEPNEAHRIAWGFRVDGSVSVWGMAERVRNTVIAQGIRARFRMRHGEKGNGTL